MESASPLPPRSPRGRLRRNCSRRFVAGARMRLPWSLSPQASRGWIRRTAVPCPRAGSPSPAATSAEPQVRRCRAIRPATTRFRDPRAAAAAVGAGAPRLRASRRRRCSPRCGPRSWPSRADSSVARRQMGVRWGYESSPWPRVHSSAAMSQRASTHQGATHPRRPDGSDRAARVAAAPPAHPHRPMPPPVPARRAVCVRRAVRSRPDRNAPGGASSTSAPTSSRHRAVS